MNRNVKYFMLSLISIFIMSCEQVKTECYIDGRPIKTVSFLPIMGVQTRATETAFEESDEISIFAMKEAQLKPSGNYADNVRYRYLGNSFIAVGNGIEVDDDGLAYYAVYPYSDQTSSKMSFVVKSDQSSHSNLTASDFCTAYASTTTNEQVNLKFSHRMSRIQIRLMGKDLTNKKISLKLIGVKTKVSVDLNANTFIAAGPASEVAMRQTAANTYEAIIAPQTIKSGEVFVVVTIDGRETKYSHTTNLDLVSGKQAEYNINVDNGFVIGGDINPWDDNGPANQLGKVTLDNSDALKFWVTGCERVGSVAIIDFEVKNLSGQNMTNVKFWRGSYDWENKFHWQAYDNMDNSYSNVQLAYDNSNYKEDFNIMKFTNGESKKGSIRVNEFDPSNLAKAISVWYKISADDYQFSNSFSEEKYSVVHMESIPLTDNRVLSEGIQSCDRKMNFSLESCKRNNDGNLIVKYSITNLSDKLIQNFHLHGVGTYTKCFDDLSNNYWWELALNAEEYHGDATTDIKPNSIIKGYIKVNNFSANARYLSCYLSCEASNYILDDEWLRFITIPVQK